MMNLIDYNPGKSDNSHEMSILIFFENKKKIKLLSAAVVIGT